MLPLTPLLLLAAVQDSFAELEAKAEAEARGAARKVLEQLLAEDPQVSHRDWENVVQVEIDTRARASDRHGICQNDRLEIEKASSGGFRKVETSHWFLVITGSGGRPRWNLEGEELEKICTAIGRSDRWFQADEAFDAEVAVVALLGLKKELAKPEPAPGVWGCKKRKPCPDPKAIGERIDPLNPQRVVEGGHGGVPCPEDLYCVSVSLSHTKCDNWITQLRVDRSNGFRFHSARAAYQLFVHHCDDASLYPEGGL